MAIDGIKIIDSDSAHDIYNAVVEGWRDGKPLADIEAEVRGWEKDFCFEPLYAEIYWTALAFSLWKIGHLPDDVRDRTLALIAQGACADWLEIDAKAQKQRQKTLDALAGRIRAPNPKPLTRPKLPKTQRQPSFAVGDVVAVELPDGEYGACVLITLKQKPRKIDYNFTVTNLRQSFPPTMEDVLHNAKIACRASIGFDASCWTDHQTVREILPRLQRLGQLELTTYRMGTFSPALGAEEFFKSWNRDWSRETSGPLRDFVLRAVKWSDHGEREEIPLGEQ